MTRSAPSLALPLPLYRALLSQTVTLGSASTPVHISTTPEEFPHPPFIDPRERPPLDHNPTPRPPCRRRSTSAQKSCLSLSRRVTAPGCEDGHRKGYWLNWVSRRAWCAKWRSNRRRGSSRDSGARSRRRGVKGVAANIRVETIGRVIRLRLALPVCDECSCGASKHAVVVAVWEALLKAAHSANVII